MSSEIGNKTPSQVFNDLFYLNNGNRGVDSTPRSIYSGNGVPTSLKIGVDKMEADFNKGVLVRPVLGPYYLKFNDIGEVSESFNINTDDGNIQKIKLLDSVSFTITTDSSSTVVFELTLIVEQSSGGDSLSCPGGFRQSNDGVLTFSNTPGSIDIFKFITYDGGTTWLAYNLASNIV